MDDRDKTKEQLICELETLRRKTASLEAADVERKRAEHKLRENERLLRTLVDASPESILLLDTNETILLANETSAQRFGRLVDELVGKRPRTCFPPRWPPSESNTSSRSSAQAKRSGLRTSDRADTMKTPCIRFSMSEEWLSLLRS